MTLQDFAAGGDSLPKLRVKAGPAHAYRDECGHVVPEPFGVQHDCEVPDYPAFLQLPQPLANSGAGKPYRRCEVLLRGAAMLLEQRQEMDIDLVGFRNCWPLQSKIKSQCVVAYDCKE